MVVRFEVVCAPPGGAFVRTVGTGDHIPDVVEVWIEEAKQMWDWGLYEGHFIGPNTSIAIGPLSPGTHVVELRGLPQHCTAEVGSGWTISVAEDRLTPVDLTFRCAHVTLERR